MPFTRRRSYYRPDIQSLNIPAKANRVLNIVLVAIVLIIVRIWHLAVIQYDEKLEESRKPQRRIIVEPATRATIRDRFNIPLAINKVQYQAAILYSQLRQVPSVVWEAAPDGKRIKRPKRKEYIANLSKVLGNELGLDPERLEDLIHSKGPFYYQIPFIIKEDISEKEYYRLKMLEKDWLGIQVQRLPRRHYPHGKVGGDIIGYMGAINRTEYEAIIREIKTLQSYLEEREALGEAPLPEGYSSPPEVRRRLKDLQERAYTINDYVGKTGIEGRFEQELRGFHGKKSYYSDARGNFLRELPGSRDPLPGQRFLLTISVELQEYAEKLLAQNERIREGKVSGVDFAKQALLSVKQPWIKGGSIVAMDPHTGEILAMASYPRYDPNDFIVSGNAAANKKKRSNIMHWFESEAYIGEIWDRKRPLERERFNDAKNEFFDEEMPMTWDNYLAFILPKESPARKALDRIKSVENAVRLQQSVDRLLALSGQGSAYALFNALYDSEAHHPYGAKLTISMKEAIDKGLNSEGAESMRHRKLLDRFLADVPGNYDKVLVVDLCRVAVCGDAFDDALLKKAGMQPIGYYRDVSASLISVEEAMKEMARDLFREIDFKPWRKAGEKAFLKEKREEEKASKRYAKPYLDYIDAEEQSRFKSFWGENRWTLLAAFLLGDVGEGSDPLLQPYLGHFQAWHQELDAGAHQAMPWRNSYHVLRESVKGLDAGTALSYLMTLRGFEDLNRPLLGRYRHLRKKDGQQMERHLAAAFYPAGGYGYGRSQAYRQATTQGSIFKLVTAYEALVQRYNRLEGNPTQSRMNPLQIVDQVWKQGKETYVGYDIEGRPIPQLYKGGRLPKSSVHTIGKLDIIKAIETSSNPYFSMLAGDVLESPNDLAKAARLFSYGHATGIDLPGEIPGKVPDDLETNRTGLYAAAIGQHSLVVTPLQSSVMLAALANGGKVLKPKIVAITAGQLPRRGEYDESCHLCFPYQEGLALAGLNFQVFAAASARDRKNLVKRQQPEVVREIFMPEVVRGILLEGMRKVVIKTQNESLGRLSRLYRDYPEAISDYVELKDSLIGKTSTAESMENLDLDLEYGTNKYTHVWFGGISFDEDSDRKDAKTYVYRDALGVPELVVVVYLRFGGYGKEAAPVAAQIVNKWKEIKSKRL